MTSPATTIVIPAHDESRFLPDLFESISLYGPENAEVILVDNGSEDGTGQIGRRYGATVVRAETVLFPSVARNLGVAHSSRRGLLVFFDADVVLTQDWRDEWHRQIESFQSDPLRITGGTCDVSRTPSWIELAWFRSLRSRQRTYVNGANLVTTHEAFERVGGFDRTLATGEDVDFCARAKGADCRVVVNNNFRVYHEGYPKSCSSFIRRERWHGSGDFVRAAHVVQSRVALATMVFVLAHIALVVGLIETILGGSSWLVGASVGTVCVLCVMSAIRLRASRSLVDFFAKAAIGYLYFIGRSLSLWDAVRTLGGGPHTQVAGSRSHR